MFSDSSCPQFRESACRSRREFLRAGSLSLFGLGLPTLLQAQRLSQGGPIAGSAAVARSFGKAKACILLFMWGGPAQQETWDLKPDAPEQVRGEFRPIATERARHHDLRALPDARPAGAPAGDHPLGPPRRRQPHDGHARAA